MLDNQGRAMSTKIFTLEVPVEHRIDVTYIGAPRVKLSRRKARKLAYRYKGSSRGYRYLAFLAGDVRGFEVHGKRLVRTLKVLRKRLSTLHAVGTSATVRQQTAFKQI